MYNRAEEILQFKTLASINAPRITRAIAMIVVAAIILTIAFIFYVPWVQTSYGTGKVIALDPRDRVQNINALVQGRIDKVYVTDGARVKKGDPIMRLIDNDPLLLSRLQAERTQVLADIAATDQVMQTARLDVERTGKLYREGLAARREFEAAQIKVGEFNSKLAQGRAALTRVDVNLNRQSAQVVRAPRDGLIMRLFAGDVATMVKQGDTLASFAPEESERVVELYVDGRDIPLIKPGRRVRLEFEGWPAIQFSGWPSVATGLFDGRVRAIDASASTNGLFRLIIEPSPDRGPWPKEPFVRLGANVSGWVLMDTVSVGFELWRQLNDFPLQYDYESPSDSPDVKSTVENGSLAR